MDHYVDAQGKHRIKGNKSLKASQSYPTQPLVNGDPSSMRLRFGHALAKLRTRHEARLRREARRFLKAARQEAETTSEDDGSRITAGFSGWMKSAQLESVFRYLTK